MWPTLTWGSDTRTRVPGKTVGKYVQGTQLTVHALCITCHVCMATACMLFAMCTHHTCSSLLRRTIDISRSMRLFPLVFTNGMAAAIRRVACCAGVLTQGQRRARCVAGVWQYVQGGVTDLSVAHHPDVPPSE